MNTSERAADLGHNNLVLHPFTVRKAAEGRALYIAMCKGKVPQRGIHRRRNSKPVSPIMGQGFAYHGAHVDMVANS
jgi:hypothetical protein